MSYNDKKSVVINRLHSITRLVDEDNEIARLQSSALAGTLMGGWLAAGAIEMGYTPLIAAGMITVGVIAGLSVRALA